MKKVFLSIINRWGYPLFLACIVGIIVGANYTPGTFLSGWDTLHPEFNLPLAFSRVITGVWRTDQGLGAVAIQSDMAELPRLLYLWITSLVLPESMLRYSYFFLMLLAGPLGMYALIKKLLHNGRAAFVGSLIYLCNFATVQQFIVPLEMFAAQYGFLPWILLTIFSYLEKPTKKLFAILAILSFFAGSQAQTATLLYAYILEVFLVLTAYLALHRTHNKKVLKRVLIISGIILATNLYIILPNIYAASTHGLDVANSKVNRLFSPEAFAKNQLYGTPANAAVVKNFLFDWDLYDYQTRQFSPVVGPWVTFANNPAVIATGYGIFALSLAGVILAIKKKQKVLVSFLPIYIVSFIMLCNGTWPVTKLFDLLGTIAPVAREALRFPFTKFSILFITGLSIFAAYAADVLFKKIKILTIIIAIALLFSFLPAFEGYLIQPAMRIAIPQEYFDMFTWFNTQNRDSRVAILPIYTFWNWTYYTWGYQGAGFLQFGIPQPILDRDYDRWTPTNEQYEQEMSYAVYSQNPDTIRSVLTKYNVTWVLVDNSVFVPASNENQTLLWLLPDLLERAGLTKTKSFGENISVYQVANVQPMVAGYTSLPSTHSVIPYNSLINREERLTQAISGTVVKEFTPVSLPTATAVNCTTGTEGYQPIRTQDGIQYTSTDTPLCDHIDLSSLNHSLNYEVEITSKNESGFPLELCINNSLTSHCDVYVYLGSQKNFTTERFLLPRLDDYGIGYSLNLNNFTIRGMTSVNDIQSIRILSIASPSGNPTQPQETATAQNVTQLSPILFRIDITRPVTTLALWQTYEQGWIPLEKISTFPFVKPVGTHIVLDNWANGWTGNFGTSDIIYIIYRPQLLEWIGFIV